MNKNETRLGLFEKKGFIVCYCFVTLVFIFAFLFILICGNLLMGLLALAIMSIFWIQWSILKFIKIESDKIIVQSLFFRDVVQDLNSLNDISGYLPFSSIMRISFNDGRSYLYWGGGDNEVMNRLKKERRIKSNK